LILRSLMPGTERTQRRRRRTRLLIT